MDPGRLLEDRGAMHERARRAATRLRDVATAFWTQRIRRAPRLPHVQREMKRASLTAINVPPRLLALNG